MQHTSDTSSRQEQNWPFLHSAPQGSNIAFPEPVIPKQCPPRRQGVPMLAEQGKACDQDREH